MSKQIEVIIREKEHDWTGTLILLVIGIGLAIYALAWMVTATVVGVQIALTHTVCWFGGVIAGHTAAVLAGMLRRNGHSYVEEKEANRVAWVAAVISVAVSLWLLWFLGTHLGFRVHIWIPDKDNGWRFFPAAHTAFISWERWIIGALALIVTYFSCPGDDYAAISERMSPSWQQSLDKNLYILEKKK